MKDFRQVLASRPPRAWLVTGAAGFIGSNLLEALLSTGQRVVALDNFMTGHRRNIEGALTGAGLNGESDRFTLVEGDIRDPETCKRAVAGTDVVLHQAALGSVSRSMEFPLLSHGCNVDGFLNVLVAAKDAGVRRVVYAASSSTYGDSPTLPKVEDKIGKPLSPYALTKLINEQYAELFGRVFGLETVGLRYFNVFGRRQDPDGPYAAVIPKWIGQLLKGEGIEIFGDGETSRDFCYIDNVVQANILAATTDAPAALNQVYNIAFGERTTLKQLAGLLQDGLADVGALKQPSEPRYGAERKGDVRHSLADVTKARELLGYSPTHSVRDGLRESVLWYVQNAGA